jgi:DNA-binding PadR family transcriptional regulator
MLGEFEYLPPQRGREIGRRRLRRGNPAGDRSATKRRCAVGALYTTLDRLEAKGLVTTWMGDPTPQRGGRPKRMVRVTAEGVQEAKAFFRAVNRASRGVSWAVDRARVSS